VNRNRKVVFIAAENGALPGGKVGGVADVVRDLPAALAEEGWAPTVVTPSYGKLHKLPGSKKIATVSTNFSDDRHEVSIWRVPGSFDTVENLVFDHENFSVNGTGAIYDSGDPERPYATDASKFAFFCAAIASWIENSTELPDLVHLHDWHSAFYCLLRSFSDDHRRLQDVRTVFTIHNVSYQGTRPLRGDDSSLESWFPALKYDLDSVQDPVYSNCLNPMAAAIRLADQTSTVSPTYAAEICRPSNPETGFIGGEGLEHLLATVAKEGRLAGVLNGCYYDDIPNSHLEWQDLVNAMLQQVSAWRSKQPSNEAHRIAEERLRRLPPQRPSQLLVSIGRLVAQKATLFISPVASGKPALQQIADDLDKDGLLIILGNGEAKYERALLAIAEQSDNVIFLQGYSESLADPLYEIADLFLMPSSFEPCGISQLLAMRAGLPCVVHGVGGLLDTVEAGFTGFVFSGKNLTQQANGFVAVTERALQIRDSDPEQWQSICDNASRQRFDWSSSAKATIRCLYETDHD
jgi:starch synthase